LSLTFTICCDVYGHTNASRYGRSGRRSSLSASVITCLLLVSNRIDDHHQRVSSRHDVYGSQAYKLRVCVVIIMSSCKIVYQSLITPVSRLLIHLSRRVHSCRRSSVRVDDVLSRWVKPFVTCINSFYKSYHLVSHTYSPAVTTRTLSSSLKRTR